MDQSWFLSPRILNTRLLLNSALKIEWMNSTDLTLYTKICIVFFSCLWSSENVCIWQITGVLEGMTKNMNSCANCNHPFNKFATNVWSYCIFVYSLIYTCTHIQMVLHVYFVFCMHCESKLFTYTKKIDKQFFTDVSNPVGKSVACWLYCMFQRRTLQLGPFLNVFNHKQRSSH